MRHQALLQPASSPTGLHRGPRRGLSAELLRPVIPVSGRRVVQHLVRTKVVVALEIQTQPASRRQPVPVVATGMKAEGWKKSKILLLWFFIALVCAASTVAGFSLFSGASNEWMSFIQAFAGGAILIVLANSMIPESYEHGKKLAGLFTVLGFFVSVSVILLENS